MSKDTQTGLYHEECFREFLALEKKRCSRSLDLVLFMRVDLSDFQNLPEREKVAQSIMDALSSVTRDTDVKGWHVDGLIIGILFTEMGKTPTSPYVKTYIEHKCIRALQSHLAMKEFSRIHVSWQLLHGGHIIDITKTGEGSF
jgi:hypothetical protein